MHPFLFFFLFLDLLPGKRNSKSYGIIRSCFVLNYLPSSPLPLLFLNYPPSQKMFRFSFFSLYEPMVSCEMSGVRGKRRECTFHKPIQATLVDAPRVNLLHSDQTLTSMWSSRSPLMPATCCLAHVPRPFLFSLTRPDTRPLIVSRLLCAGINFLNSRLDHQRTSDCNRKNLFVPHSTRCEIEGENNQERIRKT